MAFLTVNGITLEVVDASYSESGRDIGETTDAYDGTVRKSRQDRKHDSRFESQPLTSSDARAWEDFLEGDNCHYWSFNTSVYSDKGLGPSSSTGATFQAGSGKHGAGRLNLDPTTGSITYDTNLGSSWTVAFWWSTNGGASYTHYVVNSSGQKWVDGVRNDGASTSMLSVTSGDITLANTAGGDREVDDLVAVPFVMPTSWPPLLYTFNASTEWPGSSKFQAGGDAIPEGARTVVPVVTEARLVQAVIGGSWRSNGRVLAIEFRET